MMKQFSKPPFSLAPQLKWLRGFFACVAGKVKPAVANGAMATAVVMVMGFEGLRLAAYLDAVGIPTICYGETAGVKLGQEKSEEECRKLLKGRLGEAFRFLDRVVKVEISEPTKAALASFTYNVGEGNFQRSTLLRKLNAGDIRGACKELTEACHTDKKTNEKICNGWVYAKGIILPGLVTRREKEEAVCLTGIS